MRRTDPHTFKSVDPCTPYPVPSRCSASAHLCGRYWCSRSRCGWAFCCRFQRSLSSLFRLKQQIAIPRMQPSRVGTPCACICRKSSPGSVGNLLPTRRSPRNTFHFAQMPWATSCSPYAANSRISSRFHAERVGDQSTHWAANELGIQLKDRSQFQSNERVTKRDRNNCPTQTACIKFWLRMYSPDLTPERAYLAIVGLARYLRLTLAAADLVREALRLRFARSNLRRSVVCGDAHSSAATAARKSNVPSYSARPQTTPAMPSASNGFSARTCSTL